MSAQEKKADQKRVETTFLFLGISSLLAFNAYLSQLFFFKHYLPNHKPDEVFTTINNGLNLSILVLFQIFGAFISYTKQLILFQIFALLSLAFAPIVPIYLDESISYLICYVLFAFTGIANALANSSVFALAAYFPLANVVNVGVGQGIAGILSNVLSFVAMFLFNGGNEADIKKGAYVYFITSAGLIIFGLYLSFEMFKNKFFREIAIKNGIIKGEIEGEEADKGTELTGIYDDNEIQPSTGVKKEEQKDNVSFFTLVGKILSTNFLIFSLFFTLFTVFPGTLIKTDLFGFNFGMKINTILLIFNCSDTIGRALGGKIAVNMKNIWLVFLTRIFMLGSVFFNVYGEKHGIIGKYVVYVLTILNPALLAISNGIGSSLCFAIAPTQVEKSLAGRAGSCISFFLVVGLFFGSLASMPVQNFVDKF